MRMSKKTISIIGYKQRLLSMDMKTKLVQHVKEWLNETLKECESVRVWECESERVIFEHRHENKSCSACWEWVNERVKEWESERMRECESDLVPSFCLTFRHFFKNVLQGPGNTPMLFTKLCPIIKNGKIRFSVSFLVSVELSSQED